MANRKWLLITYLSQQFQLTRNANGRELELGGSETDFIVKNILNLFLQKCILEFQNLNKIIFYSI